MLHADEIAFHLTDWSAEAAFLVALHLYPERFTAEEIREGVQAFLIHAPQHGSADTPPKIFSKTQTVNEIAGKSLPPPRDGAFRYPSRANSSDPAWRSVAR